MKSKKLNLTIAIITVAMSILGVLIIYNDMTNVPEYDKYFVYAKGELTYEV